MSLLGRKRKNGQPDPEFSELELARHRQILDPYMEKKRPPAQIRDKMDIAYRIEGQSVEIFVIREWYMDRTKKIEQPSAKATYVKDRDFWQVSWQRADLRWYPYDADPEVPSLKGFTKIVDADKYGCFWG